MMLSGSKKRKERGVIRLKKREQDDTSVFQEEKGDE